MFREKWFVVCKETSPAILQNMFHDYYVFLVFAGIMRANLNFSQCIEEQTSKKSS